MQKFIQASDTAKDGTVDFAEFVHYIIEHEKNLMVVFKSLDENRDGEFIVVTAVSVPLNGYTNFFVDVINGQSWFYIFSALKGHWMRMK